ncbi:hypothetical protein FRX31_004406, partial [Thalictrum thalictroides]
FVCIIIVGGDICNDSSSRASKDVVLTKIMAHGLPIGSAGTHAIGYSQSNVSLNFESADGGVDKIMEAWASRNLINRRTDILSKCAIFEVLTS